MAEYKPNSHKSKAEKTEPTTSEEKRATKVISGKVKTKENNGRKFAGMFVSEDAANVKSYVLLDVLVPAIKKAISDIVTDGNTTSKQKKLMRLKLTKRQVKKK